jgi:hypothetical protein
MNAIVDHGWSSVEEVNTKPLKRRADLSTLSRKCQQTLRRTQQALRESQQKMNDIQD